MSRIADHQHSKGFSEIQLIEGVQKWVYTGEAPRRKEGRKEGRKEDTVHERRTLQLARFTPETLCDCLSART